MGRRRCAVGVALLLVAPVSAWAGPDLEVDVERVEQSVRIVNEIFHPPGEPVRLDEIAPISGNCVLDPSEACVGGPGIRKLLRFDALIHNRGDEDLVLGDPTELPELFEFSACHGHFHFAQASIYELLDEDGNLMAPGRKQGFCLEDTTRSSRETRTPRRYDCDFQGLQVGWGDLYPAQLDCQWVDVTDVPPGDYVLRVQFNPQGLLADDDPTNNEARVPVRLEAPRSAPPIIASLSRPGRWATYVPGRTLTVRWAAVDDQAIASQEVWVSLDDGESWEQLVGDLDGEASSFAWTIPEGTRASRARVRVVARDFESQPGEAVSHPFRIRNARGISSLRRLPVRRR